MKFGKDFKKQKVPEWIEAYVDYNGLKHILTGIIRKRKQTNQPPLSHRKLHQKLLMHHGFSGLHTQHSDVPSVGDIEDQVITTSAIQQENSRKLYNSQYLLSAEEGRGDEILFFQKLDDELNTVNNFYKDKVEEVMIEASSLNKQMDALIALRIKVVNQDSYASSMSKGLSEDINSSAPSEVTTPSGAYPEEKLVVIGCNFSFSEILDRVKITNTFDSPISTIKAVLKDPKDKDVRYKKQELREAEERMKQVLVEFYKKLHLLKHFSFMNLLAFSKILKKYEKITSRNVARSYMKMVDDSYLGSSDEIITLLNTVEAIFIKHFANSNRREGMKLLRPAQKREKHSVTFFSGFFSGCSLALITVIILWIHGKKIVGRHDRNLFVGTIFPLYSFFAYIVLHMLLYAANIYFWRRCRINYKFIFGFKQGTELGYREVFLLSNGLAMLVLATFLLHVHLKMDSRGQNVAFVKFLPLGLIVVLLVILYCPFDILYRSSRFFLVRCISRCLCAPLYQVSLADFFFADQLTSQVQAFRSLEYYICFYVWGDIFKRKNMCHHSDVYNFFYFTVAVIPYWLRFLQCIRRLFEEGDYSQGVNGLRYFLTIIAVVIRTSFELRKSVTWKVLAVVSSAIATFMNTYWDIVVDWGLLQRKSKNLFLRDKLVISKRSVYFVAIVLDILLRFAWLQLVLTFNVHSLHGHARSSLFAFLEILRRGMWNFFRLENEHLNNVGKYRAFKSVPLPFQYQDDDMDDIDENNKDE
ncbi:hypothetical protein Leryth_023720 [Lithospermum erythrorhizon]|nr:hypothetical protein Leryth_023720 [Lithospermum erythrorhizon]